MYAPCDGAIAVATSIATWCEQEMEDVIMNQEQLERVRAGAGFIAALDQSGGSTPKALRLYGVQESEYTTDEE